MLAVPPLGVLSGDCVDTVKCVLLRMCWVAFAARSTDAGSERVDWVIVPVAMNLDRSWGRRGELVVEAV